MVLLRPLTYNGNGEFRPRFGRWCGGCGGLGQKNVASQSKMCPVLSAFRGPNPGLILTLLGSCRWPFNKVDRLTLNIVFTHYRGNQTMLCQQEIGEGMKCTGLPPIVIQRNFLIRSQQSSVSAQLIFSGLCLQNTELASKCCHFNQHGWLTFAHVQ